MRQVSMARMRVAGLAVLLAVMMVPPSHAATSECSPQCPQVVARMCVAPSVCGELHTKSCSEAPGIPSECSGCPYKYSCDDCPSSEITWRLSCCIVNDGDQCADL
jgi:hypothetical protein